MSQDASHDEDSGDQTDSGPTVGEHNSGLSLSSRLDEYYVRPSPSPSSGRRRRRPLSTRAPSPEELSSQLAHCLRDASALLLDRLFDYLSNCPPPSEEQSSLPRQHTQRGLTLPASAIGWLSLHLYPDDGDICEDDGAGEEEKRDWWMEVPTRDRLPLIRFLLPRATHLRITSDEWPPPPPKKKKKRRNSVNRLLAQSLGHDAASSLSSPQSNLMAESPSQTNLSEENKPFLRYYYALRHSPRVDLRVFPNLSVLLLDGIPPEWISNMSIVQDKLELLRLERGCIYNMTSFLFPETSLLLMDRANELENAGDPEIHDERDGLSSRSTITSSQDPSVYPKLTHLKLSHCSIGELSGLVGQQLEYIDVLNDIEPHMSDADSGEEEQKDDSLAVQQTETIFSPPPLSLLPSLVSLSLAHNDLVHTPTALAGLSSLPLLSKLDLSFNKLSCMDDSFLLLGNLKVLLLSGNRIASAQGLDRLYSLERLSLDRNNIQDLADVAGLARLPELSMLDLYGNALEEKNPKKYRVDMLNLFRECRFASLSTNATYRQLLQILPILDGKCATKKELVALRHLTFKQSISSPMHNDAVLVPPAEEKVGEDAILSPQNGPDAIMSKNSPLLKSPPSDTAVTVAPKNRIRRITRSTRTRKAFIDDDSLIQSTESPRDGAGEHEQLSMNFQQNHRHLRLNITSLETKREPTARKVSFSVQDVISSLSVASAAPFRLKELDEEDPELAACDEWKGDADHSVGIEESDDLPSSEILPDIYSIHAALKKDTLSGFSSLNDAFSTAAADLSLLSISTVKSGIDSLDGNTDKEESFVADGEINGEVESGIVNGALEKNDDESITLPGARKSELDKTMDNGDASAEDDESYGENVAALRNGNTSDASTSVEAPHNDENIEDMMLQNMSFPEHIWEDDASVPSSIGTNIDEVLTKLKYKAAEDTSIYDGPDCYRGLNVLVNLELYFRCFVFPNANTSIQQPWYTEADENDKSAVVLSRMPRIQLCKADRDARCKSDEIESRESFRHVWSEEIVACGKPAASRLAPNRTPRRGFHGDIMFSQGKLATVSECRKIIFCSSDAALYLISDYDAVTIQSQRKLKRRQFPLPMPQDALFEDVPWPHAVARHPIRLLHRITIGFGFQKLTLHFSATETNDQEYIYILLISSKMRTISLLQQLQDHVKDATSSGMTNVVEDSIAIDNDDKQFLDALSAAVAPTIVGIVLHYQVLQQRWKHGDRGSVRRACVVTDTKIFLLDEDYVGDGSSGSYEAGGETSVGHVSLQVVESAELHQIVEVHGADADPRSITIIIQPLSRLQRTHRWRLLCRDGVGAERLVEDVRKAIASM